MRIIEAGGHVWALNLKWETAQKGSQLSKLKSRAKQKKCNVFYLKGKTFGYGKVDDKAEKSLIAKRKAVALAALLGQVYTNKIISVSDDEVLGAGRYWTVFVRDGLVVPGTDVEHADQFVLQAYLDSMNVHGIYDGVEGDQLFAEFESFSELIELLEVSPAILGACQVSVEGAVSKQQALALIGIAIGGVYFGLDMLSGEGGLSPEEIAAQERANARQQHQQMMTQLQSLPSAEAGWAGFSSLMRGVPAAVGQYLVTTVSCEFEARTCNFRLVPDKSLSVTREMDLLVGMYEQQGGTVELDPESKEISLTLPIVLEDQEVSFANAAVMERLILDTVMLAGSMAAFEVSFSGVGNQLNSQYIPPSDIFMVGNWEFKSGNPAYLPDFLKQIQSGEVGAIRLRSVTYEVGNQINATGSYVVK